MNTITYTLLQEALRILGLGERATLREIKARHRELVKRHHPVVGDTNDPEVIRQINADYRVILDYFSFAEDVFYEQNSEERFRQQFSDFYNK